MLDWICGALKYSTKCSYVPSENFSLTLGPALTKNHYFFHLRQVLLCKANNFIVVNNETEIISGPRNTTAIDPLTIKMSSEACCFLHLWLHRAIIYFRNLVTIDESGGFSNQAN